MGDEPRLVKLPSGEILAAWRDPWGVWVDDPSDPGYLWGDTLPKGWRWVK